MTTLTKQTQMTKTNSPFSRSILTGSKRQETTDLLQQNLVTLVDLSLLLKQAHWNVIGANFRAVHLHLDEIIEIVRDAGDVTAERISTLGVAPDGRAATVAKKTELATYPEGFVKVEQTISLVADALKTTIESLHKAIDELDDLDRVSQDMVIGFSASMEKHLWMVQAQEC
jgi:starvation-inducible DNA-binding protein